MTNLKQVVVKKRLLVVLFAFLTSSVWSKDTLQVCSPSGAICVKVWMGKTLSYAVLHKGQPILAPSFIDLLLTNGNALSLKNAIRSHASKQVAGQILSPVPEKRKLIPDVYNELSITFRQPFQVQFRAYDDGVAYRIVTAFRDSVVVKNEVAEFNFPGAPAAYFPEIPTGKGDPFNTSFEHLYTFKKIDSFPRSSIAYSPILVVPESGPKIAITESDLEEYPGLFVTGTGKASLQAVFARYSLEDTLLNAQYSQWRVAKHADYLARVKGTRSFPWRVLVVAERDTVLPSTDIVYRLASPSRLSDASWVKPGNITDEWIIDVNLFHVPFKAGRNTASYKYYIDFAKRFGFDRIMMDAGWSDNNDLFKVNPDINMDTLLQYAKAQGVKIAMWTLALTLDRQLDSALAQFNKWGVDFIMTDFIDRDDQKAVRFHHRIAKACAAHKIMIMFHGSYPPKGFNRTYPNAVAREAVLGSEYNIWSNSVSPTHDLQLPFIRMVAGYLDYEPGILANATKTGFRNIEGTVMSPGTRAHQLGMLVIYDNPMQFFSGNPSQGLLEPAYMQLVGSVPTTWDETKILDGKVGEYLVTARKSGGAWYIGGLTDWTARDIPITLHFLDAASYKATICADGVNAERYAADYAISERVIKKGDTVTMHLAPGGGFLIRLEKQ